MALRAPKARPTLEAMRAKLASAPQAPAAKPQAAKRRRKTQGGLALAAMGAAGCLLLAAQFLFRPQKEQLLAAVGISTFSNPLAAPAGIPLDERVRFWAYAACDTAKLRQRFRVPADALIDPADARHHLEDLLAQEEVGAQARAEAMALQRPPAVEAAP